MSFRRAKDLTRKPSQTPSNPLNKFNETLLQPSLLPTALPPPTSTPQPPSPSQNDHHDHPQTGDQTYATVHSIANDHDEVEEYSSPPRSTMRGSGIPRGVGRRGRGGASMRGSAVGAGGRGRVVSAPSGVGRGGKVGAGSALAEKKNREVSVVFV